MMIFPEILLKVKLKMMRLRKYILNKEILSQNMDIEFQYD
jgi:hypothetical protein